MNEGTGPQQPGVPDLREQSNFGEKFAAAIRYSSYLKLNQDALKRLKDEQETGFKNAKQYSQVVIGVGYAGLFAIWHETRLGLAANDHAWVGLMLTISVLAYIAQDVLNVLALVLNQLWLSVAVGSKRQDFATAELAYRKRSLAVLAFIQLAWLVLFPVAVITALIAAKTLILAFVRQLF